MDFAAARRAMVDNQLRPQAVTDPRVVAAMAAVPREEFVPPASRPLAYIDRIVQLGNGRGLTPPATLGRMLVELEPKPGERVLVVGAATGYSAAVLAELGLQVVALESDQELARQLERLASIRFAAGPLEQGAAADGPYDIILIDGTVEFIPDLIVDQLKPGGRLGACMIERGAPRIVIGVRSEHGFGVKSVADSSAAPLPGFARPKVFTF